MRFGAALPCARAAELLAAATGTTVTIQRLSARAGHAWGQLELALIDAREAAALEPQAPPVDLPETSAITPDTVLQRRGDGAFVPLVHGEGTAAIGVVTRDRPDNGAQLRQARHRRGHLRSAGTGRTDPARDRAGPNGGGRP